MLIDYATPEDHDGSHCGHPGSVGCDFCGKPAVQAWSAPNGSFGHFCGEHRHTYGRHLGVTILVPAVKASRAVTETGRWLSRVYVCLIVRRRIVRDARATPCSRAFRDRLTYWALTGKA